MTDDANKPFSFKLSRPRLVDRRKLPRASTRVDVLLNREGAEWRAVLKNLSAAGAVIESPVGFPIGARIAMAIYLEPDLKKAAGVDVLRFELEAQELLSSGEQHVYRCLNLTEDHSDQFQRASTVVSHFLDGKAA